MIRSLFSAVAAAVFLGLSSAEEARTWTDAKGRTVSGTLVRQDAASAWVQLANGKQVALPKSDLSAADKTYLASKKGMADFNSYKFDPATLKPVPGFKLGSVPFENAVESEHFLIAAGKKTTPVIAAVYAEVGERLWADLERDIPSLGEDFGHEKLLVVLYDGEDQAKSLTMWHDDQITKSSKQIQQINFLNWTWIGIQLEESFAKEKSLSELACVFRIDGKEVVDHAKKTDCQRLNLYAETILRVMQSRAAFNGRYHLEIFNLCFVFQRDLSLSGKVPAKMHAVGRLPDAFQSSKDWAGDTKKLIKAGAKPDLERLLKISRDEMESPDYGLGYGLVSWLRKDPARSPGLDRLYKAISEDRKCPNAQEFAAFFGFDDVAALDAAWLKFMESDAFK